MRAPLPLACVLLCACSSTPRDDGDRSWFDRLAPHHAIPDVRRLPAPWSRGVCGASDRIAPREGDRLLFLARIITPDRTEEQFVALQARTPDDARSEVRIEIAVFDRDGHPRGRSTHAIRRMHLTAGLHPAACELLIPHRHLEPDETGPILSGVLALREILRIVAEDETLSRLLWQVVERPSPWSVIRHLGVHPSLALGPVEPSADAPPGAGRALRTAISLTLNGAPSLRCSVATVEPRAPYSVSGGILSLVAERPGDGRLRFELHLLSAIAADDP